MHQRHDRDQDRADDTAEHEPEYEQKNKRPDDEHCGYSSESLYERVAGVFDFDADRRFVDARLRSSRRG